MLRSYLPALVFLLLGGTIGVLFAFINSVLGPKRKERPSTAEPYESGMPSEVKTGFRFGISFYMIAMLFLLFDIEVVFLFPIAVQLREFGAFAMWETIVFIVLLAVAFIYVWRRGALSWR
ncbi:MAG TPA: NADH-quinone oxidoreductase subunit A [Capillimicrobium sp.]|nr:NADH-quinone oxidoreductase subunit A [Capillimicrobium sp.]